MFKVGHQKSFQWHVKFSLKPHEDTSFILLTLNSDGQIGNIKNEQQFEKKYYIKKKKASNLGSSWKNVIFPSR